LKKLLSAFLCAFCAIALLSSCGGSQLGGGIGEFTTVKASAVSETNRLESDVVTGDVCSAGVETTPGTFVTDSVTVDFTSTGLFATGTLPLVISKITVHYAPVNPALAPALPDFFIAMNQTVLPGTTVKIPVPVVPEVTKFDLVAGTDLSMNLLPCSASLFEYYVTISFEVSEPGGNGSVKEIPAKLNVAIADRTT
jgi:hypothetical protein